MKYIDLHCDTIMHAFLHKQEDCWETTGMCDVKRLQQAGCLAQSLGIFMLPPQSSLWEKYGHTYTSDDDYMRACKKIFDTTMERYNNIIASARCAQDIQENEKQGKISAFMTVEDGRGLNGSVDHVQDYYNWGVRIMTLLWNRENCLGYPNSNDAAIMEKGLKPFGKDAVIRMHEIGMMVDVSHLSDGGFWDVVELSKQAKKPFVATHSNARSLSPHSRNLTDEMIRAVADSGGVVGLALMPEFLNADAVSKQSRIDLLIQHVRYMLNVGGEDLLSIGTDFDGFDGELEIAGPEDMYKLFDGLRESGFSENIIEKLAYKNALRVMRDTLD